MRVRSLVFAVAAVSTFVGVGAEAAPTPAQYWMDVRVDSTGGNLALTTSKGSLSVASDTTWGMKDLLGTLGGSWVRARVVFETSTSVQVTGLVGENPSAHRLTIQGATDDTSAIGYIKKHAFFVITGDVTAEQEAGGDLYYMVHVTKGGVGGDPNTGYVLAKDALVVTF